MSRRKVGGRTYAQRRERWLKRIGRWDTCYHEAGHALMMRVADVAVKEVVVHRWPKAYRSFNGLKLNGCTTSYRPTTRSLGLCTCILYAGVIAEELLRKKRFPKRGYNIRGADKEEVQSLLADEPINIAAAIRRRARERTRRILADGWPGIRTVARYLYQHDVIRGTKRLDALLNKRRSRHVRQTHKRRSTTRA